MFKNLIIYRTAPAWPIGLQELEAALAQAPFMSCSATQERAWGWVPARGEAHGPLAEAVNGQWILRFMTETKLLPASVLARKVQEKAIQIEQTTGRKPGKRETRDLKEEAKLDLLPQAFTRQGHIHLWIDPQAGFVLLDCASQSRADEVMTALVQAVPGLSLWLLDTQTAPATAMAQWLCSQEPPPGFSIDRECELKSSAEDKAVVRYARHPLDIDEIRAHIEAGKLPTRLALSWADRLSFVLTEGLQLKKLAWLDAALAEAAAQEAGFDADWALTTGELSAFLPELIAALDGESERSSTSMSAPPAAAPRTRHELVTGPSTPPIDTAPEDTPF